MEDKDILMDKSLEDLGLIKDIDTLSIIDEAQGLKVKKQKLLINIVGFVIAFAMIMVNAIVLFTIGVKFFLIIQLIMSWFIVISFLPVLKKKYI